MPRITAIEPQKRKSGRFNLYLDGEFGLAISTDTLVKHNLCLGQEISAEIRDQLIKEEDLAKHLSQAYRLLSYRPRSRWELEDYFRRRRTVTATIDLVIGKLREKGLVNDYEFARWWIEQRTKFRPKGPIALKAELGNKRISQHIIEDVLDELAGRVNNQETVERLARKVIGRYQGLADKQKTRQKLWSYLARRGFDAGTIRNVVDKVV